MIYIHFGHNNFDKNKFQPIENLKYISKPSGGLWASRLDSKYGWEKWAKNNEIDFCDLTIDFEKLASRYDAIEVLISKDGRLYSALYGWDCDSILILNPNVIITIKNKELQPEFDLSKNLEEIVME